MPIRSRASPGCSCRRASRTPRRARPSRSSSPGCWPTGSSSPRRSTTRRYRRPWSRWSRRRWPRSSLEDPSTGRAALLSSPAVRVAPAPPRRRRRVGDPAFRALSLASALSVIAIAGTIAVVLLRRSALARSAFGWSFLWTSTWDPVALRFGALAFIYGTLATTVIAITIALPLGLGAAVCLAELMPRRLADPLTFLIELLVAVPSVIYGLVGVFVLVPAIRSVQLALEPVLGSIPLFAGPAYGVGLLAAGILLAVMIVPFIVSVSRE